MRQIIFRGTDIDTGKTVKGDLQKSGESYFIKENEKWHKVSPDTIRQFTGLTDIAGSPIYEGDKVFILRDGMTTKVPMTVYWDEANAAFALIDNPDSPGWSVTFNDEDKYIMIPPKNKK